MMLHAIKVSRPSGFRKVLILTICLVNLTKLYNRLELPKYQ